MLFDLRNLVALTRPAETYHDIYTMSLNPVLIPPHYHETGFLTNKMLGIFKPKHLLRKHDYINRNLICFIFKMKLWLSFLFINEVSVSPTTLVA